ncbi:helix-turn-helix domain-containing protein [Ruminococcaceae bacterium OttesenSCG-928-I18]|nr:helix-turn-helix domain-containing protein [Ruminococcaceae bacterium OttesenSCG-928-I18]
MSNFPKMLKYLRERENLSQVELSEKIGITRSRLAMYEQGKREPDFEMLEVFADYFNVDMNFLLGNQSTHSTNKNSEELQRQSEKQQKNPPAEAEGDTLDDAWFSLAKDMQEEGLNPEDIRTILDIRNRHRREKGEKG